MSRFAAMYKSAALPVLQHFYGTEIIVMEPGRDPASVTAILEEERTDERYGSGNELERVHVLVAIFSIAECTPAIGWTVQVTKSATLFGSPVSVTETWTVTEIISQSESCIKVSMTRPEVAEFSRRGYRSGV